MLPKLKKSLTSFLLSEEGRIPKQSLLSIGSFMSAAVIGGVLASKQAAAAHVNNIHFTVSSGEITAEHGHHQSHGSHSSHSSHSNAATTATTSATTS